MDVSMGCTWFGLFFTSTTTFVAMLIALAYVCAPGLLALLERHPQRVGTIFQVSLWLVLLSVCLAFSLSIKNELVQHRVFLTAQAFYVQVFLYMGYLPFWGHCSILSPSICAHWLFFHWAIGYWTPLMAWNGCFTAVTPLIISVWWEQLHWQQFQVTRQLDRERQNLVEVQARLQSEKDSSESMCRELATEKLASEALLTKLKAEKQALEALLNMVCDASFWLASDGDTVARSEKRLDAIMGCEMLQQSFHTHVPSLEHDRLMNALHPKQSGLLESPVILLPIAILQNETSVNVDMYIVDRCQSFSSLSDDVGYLVGLCLRQISEPQCHINPITETASSSDLLAVGHQWQRRRRRVTFGSSSLGSASEAADAESDMISDWDTLRQDLLGRSSLRPSEGHRELPLRGDFIAPSNGFLKQCAKSMIDDIISCLNFKVTGCCYYHANVCLLSGWLLECRQSPCDQHATVGVCSLGAWQCKECSAIISVYESHCCMCFHERE